MRKLTNLANCIVLLSVFGTNSAQADEFPRYDRNIEKAATKRVAAKMGELRGTIQPEAEGVLYDADNKPHRILGFPIIKEQVKRSGLPPIVSLDAPDIDRIMTGSVSKR